MQAGSWAARAAQERGRRRKVAGLRWALVALVVLVIAALLPTLAVGRTTKQHCIGQLLQPPHVTKAIMYNPGGHGNEAGSGKQEVVITAAYKGVKGCGGWKRLGKYREQIKQSGRWVNQGGPYWYPSGIPSEEGNDAHEVGILGYPTNAIYAECIRGHRQPARVQFRNLVRSVHTGKVVAKGRIKSHRIHIEGGSSC